MCKKHLVTLLLCLFFIGCSKKETWYGFVFPDSNELFDYSSIGPYSTLDECKKSSVTELVNLKVAEKGYYQCGKNCLSKSGMVTITACQELVR